MKFKAAVLRTLNTPLEIEELEIPKLKCGQVLVQIHASGICGAQLGHISGVKIQDKFLPCLLGHEGSGIIVETGEGVKTVKAGDQVVMHWQVGDGIESEFPRYKRNDGSFVGAGLITTFQEYAVVSENRVTSINNVEHSLAALMGCPVTTGLGLINNEAELKMGQSIIVYGVGGVGLNIIQGAAMVSANPIIAIDLNEEKLQLAERFGATSRYLYGKTILTADVVVDTTGNPSVIAEAYERTNSGGRTILVGQTKKSQTVMLENMNQHFNGKILMDSQGGSINPSVDINRYLDLYRIGKLNLQDLISGTFSFEAINEALDTFRGGILGRIILTMKHE